MARAPTDTLRLGRYEVLRHLASGGMAEVLLARATGIEGFERHVVIKRIHADHARDPQAVSMFIDEARLAASLHHRNIVQVHDIGQSDGEYFFAMEYVHGEDLRLLLRHLSSKDDKLPLDHAATIVICAAAGLHHAHEQRGADRKPLGIVHRDVSPANILVGYDGEVKVVDFGIAKAALRSAETRSGTLKGKIAYMSPEQCLGKAVDRRSDVFALGIVLYELVTVRRLFKGDSDFMTMSTIVAGNIPPPSTHRPDLPPELEQIIMKALAVSPEARYQTAEEMGRALDACAAKLGLRTSATGLATYLVDQFGRRPEPWLVDNDKTEIDFGPDFDGSGQGLAPAPRFSAVIDAAVPTGSPLSRAREKANTGAPPLNAVVTTGGSGWGTDTSAPTTGSGTPFGFDVSTPMPVRAAQRRWWIRGGVAAVVVTIGLVIATRSSSRDDHAVTHPAAESASPPPRVVEPTGSAVTPPAGSAAMPSAGSGSAIAKDDDPTAGSAEETKGSAGPGSNAAPPKNPLAKPKRKPPAKPEVKPKQEPKPGPAPQWDPHSLFPQ